MIHRFTIEVAGVDIDDPDFEDAFYGAGCDDALISVANGVLYLDFDRAAPTREAAINSAIDDIARSGGKAVQILP